MYERSEIAYCANWLQMTFSQRRYGFAGKYSRRRYVEYLRIGGRVLLEENQYPLGLYSPIAVIEPTQNTPPAMVSSTHM